MPRGQQKPVCECGTIVSARRTKEQFRVKTSKQAAPTRQTRAEAEADLLYARGAATRDEFAARLRKLHELKGRCKKAVCEYGSIASRSIVTAGSKKAQFRVKTSKQAGPTRNTREEAEADLLFVRGAASYDEFAER